MLFKRFSYFKFFLKSSNQHGVHSPFVYDFVTKGLYEKGNYTVELQDFNFHEKLSNKEEKILKKIIVYFNPTSIITTDNNENISLDKNVNLLYFKYLSAHSVDKFRTIYPNSCIVFKSIYQNKNTLKNWEQIIQLQEATVTIDLFYFGLIFFRKKQAKEHFKIRV